MAKPQNITRLDTHDAAIGTLTALQTTAKGDLVSALNELFLSASNGKTSVATAITGMGQAATGSDTFAQLATKISAISSDSTAVVGDILSGKTAYANGKKTGTMPNNGAVTITPSAASQAIAVGYHNGAGSVAAVVVPAANVLTGTTIAGTAGTMANLGAAGLPFSYSQQTIPAGYRNGSGVVAGFSLNPGNTTFISSIGESIGGYNSGAVKIKEISVNSSGTLRVSFTTRVNSAAYTVNSFAQIFKNGVAVGIKRTPLSPTDTTYTEDIAVVANDLIQIWGMSDSGSGPAYVSNLRLQNDAPAYGTVTLGGA